MGREGVADALRIRILSASPSLGTLSANPFARDPLANPVTSDPLSEPIRCLQMYPLASSKAWHQVCPEAYPKQSARKEHLIEQQKHVECHEDTM